MVPIIGLALYLAAAAAIAAVVHLLIRRYVVAILVSGLLIVGILLLLADWPHRMTWAALRGPFIALCVSMGISALVGVPFLLIRKRRAAAVRGFDILPPAPRP